MNGLLRRLGFDAGGEFRRGYEAGLNDAQDIERGFLDGFGGREAVERLRAENGELRQVIRGLTGVTDA